MVCVLLYASHSYTLNFKKSDFNIELKDSIVSIIDLKNEASYSDDYNAPALPYVVYRILRPMGVTDEKPIVSFNKQLLYENVYIEVNPKTQITEGSKLADTIKIASSSQMSPILYSATQSMYGYTYTMLKITPFVYDAANKKLCFVSKIDIAFGDSDSSSNIVFDEKKAGTVKDFVINSEELNTFYPKNTSSSKLTTSNTMQTNRTIDNGYVDYVIITSEALKPAFQELIEWKIQKGLRAKIYTLNEIYSSVIASGFQTYPAKIRRWIDYMYQYSNLKYVLIGGDASIVPVQFCRAKYTEEGVVKTQDVPADLFYSTYSYISPIWDNNGNGLVGEYNDNIVMTPNVYLTRAPVRTEEDVQYFIQKVLRYEKTNGQFNPNNVNKMLFIGTHLADYNTYYNSAYYLDGQAYNTYIQPYWSWNRDYLYNVVNTPYTNLTTNNTLTANNLIQLINSDYHFLHINCHATKDHLKLNNNYNDYFDTLSVTNCNNTNPLIIVTSACNTNAFDSIVCLSKSFMNFSHGTVAYYGSSRLGHYYVKNNGAPSIGQSLLYDSFFFKYLLTGYPTDAPYHYGAVAAYSKMKWVDYANSSETDNWRYLQFGINPLGDPEMPIYTSIPQSFTNVQISINGNGDVTVSTGGITGCTIALTSLDNGVSYFNVVEDVSSYTFTEVDARCYVTITKHNYRPYQSRIFYPGIAGNSHFYYYGDYSIDVPNGCTVTWSFLNPNSVNNNLLTTLSNNSCQVNNLYEHRYIRETLVATIKINNTVVATRTKNISTGGDFNALVHQQGQTINGTTYPTLNNNVSDGGHTGVFELNPVTITSSDFADAVFTITGYQPTTWSKNSNGVVTAVFPQISGGTSQTTTITGNNSVTGKIFQFTLHIQPSCVLNQMLNIYNNGDEYSISMTYGEDNKLTGNWNLTIYNAQTGQVIYTQKAVEGGTTVNTSGWKSGVYVVQGQANGEAVKEKILVK